MLQIINESVYLFHIHYDEDRKSSSCSLLQYWSLGQEAREFASTIGNLTLKHQTHIIRNFFTATKPDLTWKGTFNLECAN